MELLSCVDCESLFVGDSEALLCPSCRAPLDQGSSPTTAKAKPVSSKGKGKQSAEPLDDEEDCEEEAEQNAEEDTEAGGRFASVLPRKIPITAACYIPLRHALIGQLPKATIFERLSNLEPYRLQDVD